MICCWIAADCGFLFTCPTAWVTVAKPTPKLFADCSTNFQSAAICIGKMLDCNCYHKLIQYTEKRLLNWGIEVTILLLFSSSYEATFVSELEDKASVFYLKLWFRGNAGPLANSWWNRVRFGIHKYLWFAGFYLFLCFLLLLF